MHLSLRVRVEIGELAPLELESFVAGEWQASIRELIAEIINQESRRQSPFKVNAETVAGQTKTATNLEELKNRFGIKE